MGRRLLVGVVAVLLLPGTIQAQTARQDMERFVKLYDAEARIAGFRPDETTSREQRVLFLQRVVKAFCSPHVAMKRADPGRPISDEAIVFTRPGPEYRLFWDFIISGGSSAWRLSVNGPGEHLPESQPLVNPLTLGHLPEPLGPNGVPIVPGCMPSVPTPAPKPCPVCPPIPPKPPYPGDQFFVEQVGQVLEWDYAEAGQRLNAGSVVWISRTIWRYVNEGMSIEQSVAQSRKEWRAALGLP